MSMDGRNPLPCSGSGLVHELGAGKRNSSEIDFLNKIEPKNSAVYIFTAGAWHAIIRLKNI
jgi:hypothetical protein